MPRDRLNELRDLADSGEPESVSVAIDIPEGHDMDKMKDFFKEIDEIKAGIAAIKRKVQEIEQVHSKTLTAVGDSNHDPKQMDNLMDDVNAEINKVRNKIKEMETANKKAGCDPSKKDLTSEQRIRLSQHGTLTKKFVDTVTEYQDIQTKYKNKFKDRLERQFKIVKPNATKEEIDKVLESGADSSQMFAQQILMGPQHAEAKKALYDIQERHQDIVKLEKSIIELHQLFLDMAVLVDAQGEMINQIEHYVSSAADHTNKGVEEMKKAVTNQKKSRKRMCCILFLIFTVVIVLILVVSF